MNSWGKRNSLIGQYTDKLEELLLICIFIFGKQACSLGSKISLEDWLL